MFAPVNRGASRGFTASGSFGGGPVNGDLVQYQADDAIVGGQGDLLELGEDAQADPLTPAASERGGRAGGVGDGLVGAAEPQDLQQLVEDDPVADPQTVTAQRMGRIVDRPLRQQRRELVPQWSGQP